MCEKNRIFALDFRESDINNIKIYTQMKKTLLSLLCAFTCLFAVAQSEKTYNEQYRVTHDEGATFSEPRDVVVVVADNGDGTVNFLFKDIMVKFGENTIPVGDIAINNVEVTPFADGLTYFHTYDVIEEGFFENTPYDFGGKMNDEKFYGFVELETGEDQYLIIEIGSDDFGQPVSEGKVYTEPLVVSVNGQSAEPQVANVIVVNNADGTVDFELKNFTLNMEGNEIPIGNIALKGVAAARGEDCLKHIAYDGSVDITEGDQEGVDRWYGPMLCEEYGAIPVVLNGKMSGKKLLVTIDIDMRETGLGQLINVEIGTDDFPTITSKVYTDQIVVTIDEDSTDPQEANVTVEDNGDGTINLELQNFILGSMPYAIPIGNIRVEDLPVTEGEDGMRHFSYVGPVIIQPGTDESLEWYGPQFGPIPVALSGKLDDEKLIVTIDINFMSQIINVQFGGDGSDPQPQGKVYSEPLVVTINGQSSEPQPADVIVYDNGDGTVDFELKNFKLTMEGNEVAIGNIALAGLTVTEGEDGLDHISYEVSVMITNGDQEGVDLWYGPLLCREYGAIPVVLNGKLNDEKLYVTIDIDMRETTLAQLINVEIGTDDFFPIGLKGDVNGDGEVTVADATFILNVMADEGDDPRADVNDDGEITVADYTYVLNIMADEE